jgi:hypothetical protein
MVHVTFDPDSVDWQEFFEMQHGGAYYFEGLPYMRGAGIGSIFSTLFKYLMPLGKTIGRELGKEGINTGARLLNRISSGEDLKSSLTSESQQGLKNLVDRVYEKRQKGEGRRKRSMKKSIKGMAKSNNKIKTGLAKVGPPKRVDYLGSY